MGKTARESINMAASLEKLANETAEGFTKVNAEMFAKWTVAMQNCITLNILLAAQGGTCAVVGSECCTYIPDNSEDIDDLAGKIKAESAKYHDFNKGLNFGSWLEKIFGGWGAWILHVLFIGFMILIATIVIIACFKAVIGVCMRRFSTVTAMVAHEAAPDLSSLGDHKDPENP